jgi:hypothetical protein
VVHGRRQLAASGGWLIVAGLVGFLVLAVLFEVVVGIGGRGYGVGGRYGLAVLLIVAGAANGSPAFAQYTPTGPGDALVPWALVVVEVADGRIAGWTSFRWDSDEFRGAAS